MALDCWTQSLPVNFSKHFSSVLLLLSPPPLTVLRSVPRNDVRDEVPSDSR